MAKKKPSNEVAPASLGMPSEDDWRARDDANRIMDYSEIKKDPSRFKNAAKRIKDAHRHVTRARGR